MVSCLILLNEPFATSTINRLFNMLLSHDDYEIEYQSRKKTIAFIWNKSKESIWQIAFELEYAGIIVGYGFGRNMKEARKEAEKLLDRRMFTV